MTTVSIAINFISPTVLLQIKGYREEVNKPKNLPKFTIYCHLTTITKLMANKI